MPSIKKRSTSATPITFTLPDRSVRRITKPKLSGPITIPFPPPPSPHKPLALWEIAEIDEDYRTIVNAIWAARTIRDRATKDAENQQIVDMLRWKSARCGMPLYMVSAVTYSGHTAWNAASNNS